MIRIQYIPGYERKYAVTSDGRIKSLQHPGPAKELKQGTERNGYKMVWLCKNGKRQMRYVHRLVLTAFMGECPPGHEACHNNGVPDDNRLDNLRWDTKSANRRDRERHKGLTATQRRAML